VPVVDSLVLTPLDEEWQSIRPVLSPRASDLKTKPLGSITYYLWTVPFDDGELRGSYLVVGASMSRRTPGQAYAGVFSKQCLDDWKPARVVLLGIAGSLDPERLRLGDVIVADRIFGYEVGDAEGRSDSFRPTVNQSGATDLDRVRAFVSDPTAYENWRQECLAASSESGLRRIRRPPTLRIGSVGSGNKVVKSVTFARRLKKELSPDLEAVEMEGIGLHRALYLSANRTDALMIRGVSDYSDAAKTKLERRSKDAWRHYAAANCARFIKALWARGVVPPGSTPYLLDPTLGLPSRFRQAGVRDDRIRRIGAQDVVFGSLLNRSGATPALRLLVKARYKDGNLAADSFVAHAVIERPERQVLESRSSIKDGKYFDIPATEWGLRVELLLSFPKAVGELSVDCSDDFGRSSRIAVDMSGNARR